MTEESPGWDPLTGLQDRRYVLHELERHVDLYRRYRRPFSLLTVDFDNLDWFNDTFGRAAGESALEYLATLIKVNLRDVDISCRCAKDEFIVIMEEADKEAVQTVGRRIAASAEKTTFKLGRDGVTLKVSFGTASCPDDGVEAEALLRAAATHEKPGDEAPIPADPPPPSPLPASEVEVSPPEEE